MRLVIISDTHGQHAELGKLSGDVLIHCGDFCDGFQRGPGMLADIDRWFSEQDFGVVLCVGGNHDFDAQEKSERHDVVFKNAVFLEDTGYEVNGVRFYGSPWIPDLSDWAYYLDDDGRKRKWDLIPNDTDVLITHTPPLGILDRPRSGNAVGCSYLRAVVEEVTPRVHCFGHVHASFGHYRNQRTDYVNAAMVDSHYRIVREPVIMEL